MNANGFFNIVGSILTIALVSTVLIHGSAASQVITASGNAFSQSVKVAMGG